MAVSEAVVALPNVTWQVVPFTPQFKPPPVTVPPVGVGEIVSRYVGVVVDVKVAPQVRGPFNWTQTLEVVPEQAPVHPVNV